MKSVTIKQQLSPIGATQFRSSFFSSLLHSLYGWAKENTFGIGVYAVLVGLTSHNSFILNTNLNSIIPFASEISVGLGLVLSMLGIISKAIEFRSLFLKHRKKRKNKKQ